ncbi:transient receptor potential cation channel subfamily V member 1-like [Littorina saxatilis]|uniref:transient receptor potential cation channel subfamily V member 1-like n=1 Tax=Littorina saxatilis TaxID=31220 RepID=UPI0038B463FD
MSDREIKKRQFKRQQVAPENITEESELESNSTRMEDHGLLNNRPKPPLKFDTLAKVVHGANSKANALKVITNVKNVGNKWMEYTTQRRLRRKTAKHADEQVRRANLAEAGLLGDEDDDSPKMSGIGLDGIHQDFVTPEMVRKKSSGRLDISMIIESNRTLLTHFSKMADEPHEAAKINLHFVENLLKNGADINSSDKYGQTLLHEAARAWHVDVARWLLERGIDINKADDYGRTALHVAAAVDSPEMVYLLLDFGDRSETARLLLELHAPIGVSDYQGQKAITWMITKMAPVATEALNQFRSIDRHNRKQYFYLNLLVQDRKLDPTGRSQTPLGVAVTFKQYDLLLHPTMRRLQHEMWIAFGRFWALWNLGINFLYILVWTLIGILVEYDQRHSYSFPDDWYRMLLWVIAVGATAWQIIEEVMEFVRSKRSHKQWEDWREKAIQEDMRFCHPRWPEEEDYLKTELDNLDGLSPKYFNDMWNIFDWTCYILLLVDIITHVVDVAHHSETLARTHIRFMAVTIILLWLRLMKNARAFTQLGPFIVMLGHMMKDCARFLFLYMEFYLPFMAVFWMVYGGTKKSQVDGTEVVVSGYQYPGQLIFSLLRLTLVDDYDYDNMSKIDDVFTDIILAAWFLLSSILCLNLFIALLSDTFQRVYDNAQANSVMQKAITILNIWEGISAKRKKKFFDYIEDTCSPLQDYYDDDLTQTGEADLKKVTFQIKDKLDDFTEHFKDQFGDSSSASVLLGPEDKKSSTGGGGGGGGGGGRPGGGPGGSGGSFRGGRTMVTAEKFENEVSVLHEELRELHVKQEDFMETYRRDMDSLQTMLRQVVSPSTAAATGTAAGLTAGVQEAGSVSVDSQRTDSMDTPVSKLKKKKKRKANPMDMVLSVEMLEPTSGEFPTSLVRSPNSNC